MPAATARTGHRIAVVGGGLCGLTAAIRAAEQGHDMHLFEAAANPGGRTRSFIDRESGEYCDNGPHLLIGAYHRTCQLLAECNALQHVNWQSNISLPLWDKARGHFSFTPSRSAPFALSLLLAAASMPGHNWRSAITMLRLAMTGKQRIDPHESVQMLLTRCKAPNTLIRDLLEPLCLGAMNEHIDTASAATFARVLNESFASRDDARLGWFNKPLQLALIEPMVRRAESLGVEFHCHHRVRSLQESTDLVHLKLAHHDSKTFDAAIVALPAYAADRLYDCEKEPTRQTAMITNVHLWFEDHPGLKQPFVGGIGSHGQWFFDVTAQMESAGSVARHLCAVISADDARSAAVSDDEALVSRLLEELSALTGITRQPCHRRIVREKRATVLVRPESGRFVPGRRIIDACEAPVAGELPATIELAVIRGEQAVLQLKL